MNPRTKGDVIRELVAHAFIRIAYENGYRDTDKLHYTGADRKFILEKLDHFVEFKINPLFVEEWTVPRIRKRRPRDQVKEIVLDLLKDGEERSWSKIVEHVLGAIRVDIATIKNALNDLIREGKICQPKTGSYKLKEDCRTCKWKEVCHMAGP